MASPEQRFGFGDKVSFRDLLALVVFEHTEGDRQSLNLSVLDAEAHHHLANVDAGEVVLIERAPVERDATEFAKK